jgi:hypothetical protein
MLGLLSRGRLMANCNEQNPEWNGMRMLEKFTGQAQQVIINAKEEARLRNHGSIAPEHLLIALIHSEGSAAVQVLEALGIALRQVHLYVTEYIASGDYPSPGEHTPFTRLAIKVLELSELEAVRLGAEDIGTEHILSGLVRLHEGIVARVLARAGAYPDRVHQQVSRLQGRDQRGAEGTMREQGPAFATIEAELLTADEPPTPVSARVFISYRREETSHAAGRISDWLIWHLGEGQVFMDVDSIAAGMDVQEVITNAVANCGTLLAVIGPSWISICNDAGRHRLSMVDDYVRLEIEAALKRNIRVIPVLVDGAELPKPWQLPKSVAGLAQRNALKIRHESFREDVNRLIRAVDQAP